MKKEHTDMYVLTSLDDIAWLLNIRGNDIAYNPGSAFLRDRNRG